MVPFFLVQYQNINFPDIHKLQLKLSLCLSLTFGASVLKLRQIMNSTEIKFILTCTLRENFITNNFFLRNVEMFH